MKLKLIKALELDKAGNWDCAHQIVQEIESIDSYRIHAYLHRVEGDIGNARYWYRRAGAAEFSGSLKEEWEMLFNELSVQ